MMKVELNKERISFESLNEEVKEKLRYIHLTNDKPINPVQEFGKVNDYDLVNAQLYYTKYPEVEVALIDEKSDDYLRQTFYHLHAMNLELLYHYHTNLHFDERNSYIVKRKNPEQVGYGIIFAEVEEDFYYLILEI